MDQILKFRECNELSVELQNSLIKYHGVFGDLERARSIYDSLGDHGVRDAVNVNTMMEALCANDAHSECIEMAFDLIEGRINGVNPDSISFVTALRALTRCSSLHRGVALHDILQRDFPLFLDDESVAVHLITFYGKCSMTTMAEAVFTRFCQRNGNGHSLEIWHSVLKAFGRNGDYQNTQRLYQQLIGCHQSPNNKTFIVMINALSHCGHIAEAEDLWTNHIANEDMKWDCNVVSALVDGFARNGKLDEAKRVLMEYKDSKKGPLHEAMWISLISGCKLHRNKEMADALYQEIQNMPHFDEDHLTSASVLVSNLFAIDGE